jgi:predicted AlkP superfamily phosphohydrolase/phosphomutase
MTDRSARVVVIGLELGDGPLIRDWANAGLLPAISSMMMRGTWGWLETTADRLHISAWPTLYTGATPGDHGVYFTFQPAPGLQGYRRFQPGQYGRSTFWSILDAAGYRCAVLDAPYTHPEEGYRGLFINDWGTWAHYLQPGSVPHGLLKKMESACGKYPLGQEANDLGLAPLESSTTAKRLAESIRTKAEATCWLMKQNEPEVVFSVFGETHVAGHYCWSADLENEQRRLQPSDMLSVYQAVSYTHLTLPTTPYV